MHPKLLFLICSSFFSIALVGCGGELPYTDNSKDEEAFAKSVKSVVVNAVEAARRSPEPADALRTAVTTLSELETAPTGQYLPVYQELHGLTKALLDKSENGKPSDLQSKLNEIKKAAEKLPGEVEIMTSANED